MDDNVFFLDFDDERQRDIARRLIFAQYEAQGCAHCGGPVSLDTAIVSVGGEFAQPLPGNTKCAAHPQCFYTHEADQKWRDSHPEHKPDAN